MGEVRKDKTGRQVDYGNKNIFNLVSKKYGTIARE